MQFRTVITARADELIVYLIKCVTRFTCKIAEHVLEKSARELGLPNMAL